MGKRQWIRAVTFCTVAGGCEVASLPVKVPAKKTAQVIAIQDHSDIVTMGAPYLYLEQPEVDWGPVRWDAIRHCEGWRGYSHAEPVGKTRRHCLRQVGDACLRYALVGDHRCMPQSA